jgi:8-oxo-dGTP pyrophosphatase MutT (NUDIX family)
VNKRDTDERAFVCLLNDKQQVFCVKRAAGTNNPGTWGLPGGHRHEGETLQETACRETLEETSIVVMADPDTSFLKVTHGKRTVFFLKAPEDLMEQVALDPEEVESVHWLDMAELIRTSDSDLHKSLRVALTILMELEANYLYAIL